MSDEWLLNMPKVSILVPIYNVEKYLRQCLDSLINQTLKDIEIICINDGSTDACLDILQEYEKNDNRIRIINKINSGYGDSMNKGLNFATGEYIGVVESDDFVDTNMFEELYNIAKKNNCEIVKSDWFQYWTDKNLNRKFGKIPRYKCNKIINAKKDKSLLRFTPSIWSAIYKREFLDNYNIRFLPTPGASYQDTSFTLKVFMCANRVIFTSKAYLHYRQDNINSSVKSTGKIYSICNEYQETERFIEEHSELSPFKEYIYALEYKACLWNLQRMDEAFYLEFIDFFSTRFKAIYNSGILKFHFFKKVNFRTFNYLLNNKQKFLEKEKARQEKLKKHSERAKQFSIRINSSRISVILFGKQIVKIG